MLNYRSYMTMFLLPAIALLQSCSSTTAIKITSSPADAKVSVVDNSGGEVAIGKTPLSATEMDVFKSSARYSQIKVKKEGYLDQEIVLLKSTFGSEINLNVQLKKDENVQNVGEQTAIQEKVASTIARANALIQSKQYNDAEQVMMVFVEQFPSVSIGYDYLGNLNYLQNKYSRALRYYTKAVNLNPNNAERKVIVDKLQNLVKSQSGDIE